MTLGFIGTGRMGSVMAARLLAAGHDLVVWNRDPAKATPLAANGARLAKSAADVFGEAAMILLMTDAAGSAAVLAAPASLEGRVIVAMGTFAPDAIVALAGSIRAAGGRCVEAPVLGTVGPAAAGQLVALVGGDPDDVAAVRPVLDVLARRVVHTGAIGSAGAMKLAHNMLLSNYWTILGETLALGSASGIDLAVMLEILVGSGAANGVLPLKLPTLRGEPHAVAFDMAGMARELAASGDIAANLGLTLAVTRRTADLAAGVIAAGDGGRDVAFLATQAAALARPLQA